MQISLEAVSKRHDGTPALVGVDLRVDSGELLALTGPTGSGKTTLLRVVAGLDAADSGHVLFDGEVVDGVPTRARDIALVTSQPTMPRRATVAKHLRSALTYQRLAPDEVQRRVTAEARALGLERRLDRQWATLAAGDRQRLAIGHAMVRMPRAFLLDDPLAQLGGRERASVRTQLSTLQRGSGVTTIYVTHDQAEAMALADRVAVLVSGTVQQVADPQTVYHRPASAAVASFFSRMSLLRGRVVFEHGVAWLELGRQRLRLSQAQARALDRNDSPRVLLGLPPEDVWLAGGNGPGGESLCVTVQAVAGVGHRREVEASLDGAGTVRATCRDNAAPVVGEDLRVRADIGRAAFFDPGTGLALAGLVVPGR